ncbi:MAG: OmpA family protein [Bdellovibrionota bacterium]
MKTDSEETSRAAELIPALALALLLGILLFSSGCAKKPATGADGTNAGGSTGTAAPASGSSPSGKEIAGNVSSLDESGRVRERSGAPPRAEGDALIADIHFALDSAELDADARETLDEAARLLKENPSWFVTVEGHCDERGTWDYNLALGQRRAEAARQYLKSRGIAAKRISTVSLGEAYPEDPASNEEAWAKNRRGHFAFQRPGGNVN